MELNEKSEIYGFVRISHTYERRCTYVWSLCFILFYATVGDAFNYVYRKKRGGSCSSDHQDGGISSQEAAATRNRTMLDCIIWTRPPWGRITSSENRP